MSFPYIILDLIDGEIVGIREENEQEAIEKAQDEDMIVIDTKNSERILSDGSRYVITDCDGDPFEALSDDADFPEPDHGEDDSDDIDKE